MNLYTREYRVRSTDVDLYRRLRLSTLFTMLQEASIAHTEALDMGRDKTLDKGLLWVVTHQSALVSRLPEYDEEIVLTSWPGKTMHVFFPRYYQITDHGGAPLISASALWSLMDADTRAFAFPEKHGIRIEGVVTGEEIALPRPLKVVETDMEERFSVPYSYVDLNGHMNNTRYFDLAEDLMPPELRRRPIREIATEYGGEAKLGDPIELRISQSDDVFYIAGENGKRLFRMLLNYE